MNKDEFKLRIFNRVNCLIDQYFSRATMGERFINATLKIIVKNNVNKVDSVLTLFQDENGNINANEIVNQYAEQMGDDKFSINLREYVGDSPLKNMIPDRTLTISKDDLYDIINGTVNM